MFFPCHARVCFVNSLHLGLLIVCAIVFRDCVPIFSVLALSSIAILSLYGFVHFCSQCTQCVCTGSFAHRAWVREMFRHWSYFACARRSLSMIHFAPNAHSACVRVLVLIVLECGKCCVTDPTSHVHLLLCMSYQGEWPLRLVHAVIRSCLEWHWSIACGGFIFSACFLVVWVLQLSLVSLTFHFNFEFLPLHEQQSLSKWLCCLIECLTCYFVRINNQEAHILNTWPDVLISCCIPPRVSHNIIVYFEIFS